MELISYYANIASFTIVIATWFVFAGTFLLRKKPESTTDKTRAPKSWFGLILQCFSFPPVWMVRRSPVFSPIVEGQYALNVIVQILAVVIVISSVWLAMAAVKELGKQWSLAARLVEDHKLITTGVYQTVRHPIYTAMLGMLVATGLAYSNWIALVVSVIIFIVGTKIRTNLEEGLLRDAFGQEFEDWKRRVPGLIPFVKI
ncbi:MAG: isoprenylcysteine carboxylmethyltransferase family protein [Acidobacteriota bacterium]